MKVRLARRTTRDLESLSPALRSRVKKQLDLLRVDLRHPSLRAKKYDQRRDIWQGRVNRDYRFYFTIEGDTYRILSIIPHPSPSGIRDPAPSERWPHDTCGDRSA